MYVCIWHDDKREPTQKRFHKKTTWESKIEQAGKNERIHFEMNEL